MTVTHSGFLPSWLPQNHGDGVTLEVADQGHGIPADKLGKPGVGLQGMRERIREFGGKLEMDSSSQGTTIRATVPQTPKTSAKAASF